MLVCCFWRCGIEVWNHHSRTEIASFLSRTSRVALTIFDIRTSSVRMEYASSIKFLLIDYNLWNALPRIFVHRQYIKNINHMSRYFLCDRGKDISMLCFSIWIFDIRVFDIRIGFYINHARMCIINVVLITSIFIICSRVLLAEKYHDIHFPL